MFLTPYLKELRTDEEIVSLPGSTVTLLDPLAGDRGLKLSLPLVKKPGAELGSAWAKSPDANHPSSAHRHSTSQSGAGQPLGWG